jgi:transposase
MNVHKNARLTLIGRARLVKRVLEQGDTPSAAAAAEGVSVRTTFKWLARYRAEGHAGLSDRCSRPRRVRSALSARQRERVAQLRRQRRPYREIARLVGGSLSAVARYARALGLNRLSALEPKAPIVRYERARPGELVHLDTKRLARFWRPGHRVTADPSVYSDGAGYQFLHVAIDDHARVAYCELHARERASDAVRFLKGLLTYYRRLGIRVARLLTDNGSCYRAKRFARACERLWASSIRSPAPIGLRPTARPSASSRPRSPNGPTCAPTSTGASAPRSSRLGCIATTGIVLMPASATAHPSADLACR